MGVALVCQRSRVSPTDGALAYTLFGVRARDGPASDTCHSPTGHSAVIRLGSYREVTIRRGLVALVAAALVATIAPLTLSPAQAYAGTPPWVGADEVGSSGQAKGTLGLFDVAGDQLFSGDDISNIGSYLAASTTATVDATTATFTVAVPSPTAAPASWCTRTIQSNVVFSPAPSGLPAGGTEFGTSIAGGQPFIAIDPALANNVEAATLPPCAAYTYSSGTDYTSTYANVLELRLTDSLDGTYWRTVIEYNPTPNLGVIDGLDPGAWRQLYPAPTLIGTSITTPTASPTTNPLGHGATIVLSTTVSADNTTHQDGAVEFYDDDDPLFYSPYTSWNSATGVATAEISPTDGDHHYYARFTPTNPRYLISTSTRLVRHVNRPAPVLTGAAPAISGTSTIGSTLTCAAGGWDSPGDSPYTYTYQWRYSLGTNTTTFSTVSDVLDLTNTSPTLLQAYYGASVTCRVTATNGDGVATTSTSTGVSVYGGPNPVAPVNSVRPSVTGARATQRATCSAGTWTQAGLSYRYRWYVSGTGSPFRTVTTANTSDLSAALPTSYVGHTITCNITGTNPDSLAATGVSTAVTVGAAPTPAKVVTKPVISGASKVGGTVGCSVGTWNQSGLHFGYVWKYTSGTAVRTIGFRARRLLTSNIYNAVLSCTVTATNRDGLTAKVTVTGRRVGLGPAPTIRSPGSTFGPRIISAPRVGTSASASRGTWAWVPSVTTRISYTYQWLRYPSASGGKPLGKPTVLATTPRYTPKAADRGRYLVVRVSALHRGYATGHVDSTPRRVV